MSGGHYNYVYSQVESIHIDCKTPLRRAFSRHLGLVAKALHDIEWVDSGDYGPGDEVKAIEACLSHSYADSLKEELNELIAEAKRVVK